LAFDTRPFPELHSTGENQLIGGEKIPLAPGHILLAKM
jgi:hypothetical protein